MEQFRQRVAATCHIGPLDADETRGYIEHRLKCAGSKGMPSFDAEVFADDLQLQPAASRGASTPSATACCCWVSCASART